MKKNILFFFLAVGVMNQLVAQIKHSENVIVITMDGLRWQEVFEGADSLLVFDTAAPYNTKYLERNFWYADKKERREKLMPFFWNVIAKQGVLLGNRNFGNYFNNANPYWFSYPGYNEIITGYPDTAVNSNDKIPNKNVSVFEVLNKQSAYKGKVAAFGSWDVFASIFNEKRSGIPVNDGFKNVTGQLSDKQKMFNELQHEMPDLFHGSVRLDVATFNMAFEYLKKNKPKVFFLGLGDTDEFAHAGKYDYYLDATIKSDDWIRRIWEYVQSEPQYKDKTTVIITTDHGRGLAEGHNWRHHGSRIAEASEMWMAAIGPSIKPIGEAKDKSQAWQGQIAATIALLLHQKYQPAHEVLPPLSAIIK